MKTKKDILLLCQYFYPEYVSSATLPYETAQSLSEVGFKVGVLCGYPKEYLSEKSVSFNEEINGITIKRVQYLQLSRKKIISRLINYFSFTVAILFKIRVFKNYKSVIVYSNPPILPLITILAKKIYKTKIVFVSYDVYPEIAIKTKVISEKGIISKLMMTVNSLLMSNLEQMVVLSQDMKDYLLKNRAKLAPKIIKVIPNWYSENSDKKKDANISEGIFKELKARKNFVISYIGNMGVAQDMETIVSVIKHFKNDRTIDFVFAGHGNKLDELKDLAKKEMIANVFFYGFLQGNDFNEVLKITDIFLLSLKKQLAGLAVPSKTYSYLSAGKPIIAIMDPNTDIVKDIIKYNAGIAVQEGDSDVIISQIDLLKNNNLLKKEIGKNSRRLFEDKYTFNKGSRKYVHMMIKILEDTNV